MRQRIERKPEPKAQPADNQVRIPHDLVNEQVMIAAAIADDDARRRLVRRYKPDYFFGKGHPEIWSAIESLERQGLDYSPATLHQLSNGAVDQLYLAKLVSAHPTAPPNLGHHEAALAWDKARIEAARGPVLALLKLLNDPAAQPDAVRAAARASAVAFEAAGGDLRYLRDPKELVRQQHAEIVGRKGGAASHPYGLEGLDWDGETGKPRMIPGCAPGQVTVITGVAGSGKSTVTARIVLGQVELGQRVLYGAWEMSGGITLELLAAMRCGISRSALMTGALTADELEIHREQMDIIAGYVRFMDMPFGRAIGEKTTNERNLDIIHRYMADSGCDVGAFDLWKRCLRYTDPDDEEQALIRQQAISAETRMHSILVHQQRLKDLEQRPDKRPTREGNKGSGAWVEVPDTMIGVHRPALWKRMVDEVLELDILKQRWGIWPQAVEFDWAGEFGSLENGRTIPYDPPGSDAETDPFADFKKPSPRAGGRGKGSR